VRGTGARRRAIPSRRIPLDKAHSSRYRRAIESAAFFVDGTVATDMLSGEGSVGKEPGAQGAHRGLSVAAPATGRNLFMMAHGGISWEPPTFQYRRHTPSCSTRPTSSHRGSRVARRMGQHRVVAPAVSAGAASPPSRDGGTLSDTVNRSAQCALGDQ